MDIVNKRLQKLLHSFNTTLQDLPTEHTQEQCSCAKMTVRQYGDDPYEYICHLADVIDKMQTALMNASLVIDGSECPVGCDGCVDEGTVQELEHLRRDREHLIHCLCKMVERYV